MHISQDEIQKILPQRYPFIFIDKVIEFQPTQRIVAVKNFTVNEYYTPGHFPNKPIMPGVLVIEAIAQTAIVFFAKSYPDKIPQDTVYYLGKVEARFFRPIVPGDQLKIEVTPVKIMRNMGIVLGVVSVEAQKVAEAQLMFSAK